jgi:excisionase family DNA binding protein
MRTAMMKNNLTNSMLTVREVSQILHVHSNTLRRWSDLGLIKAYRIGPRGDRRFRQEDITLMLLEESKGIPTNVN